MVVAIVVGMGSMYRLASADLPDQKKPPLLKVGDAEGALKKTMLEEARKVFELRLTRYQNGGALEVETLYQWSSRWLEAELDLAADATGKTATLKAHLERMKEVEKSAVARMKAGQGPESDAAAGRYYRTQAEVWLVHGHVR